MFPVELGHWINKAFGLCGLKVQRAARIERSGLAGLLRQAKEVGFCPATVIDVGAAYGLFTRECHRVFPDAQYLLLEPLKEYETVLTNVVGLMPKAHMVSAAAAAIPGEMTINVHPDLEGSSCYLEEGDASVNGSSRTVRAVALDGLARDLALEAPFLLKVDVQGAELDVLRGAIQLLERCEFVLLEVSLFEFFKGGPQFYDVVGFMKARGFVAYDIGGLQYRLLDNALSQVDIAFCKDTGLFRRSHVYATPAQRAVQNRRFALRRARLARTLR